MARGWFYEMDGTKRYLDTDSKTVFMPYDIDPKDYSLNLKNLMKDGWVVQLEIV